MAGFTRRPLANLMHAMPLIGIGGFKNLHDNGGAEAPKRPKPRPAAEDEPARPRRSLKERRKLLAAKLQRREKLAAQPRREAPPRPRGS